MNHAAIRFLAAAAAIALGAAALWLSAAIPIAVGAAPGSALSTAPDGLSGFAQELRAQGALAQTVRIDAGDAGIGLSPLPWDAWRLGPGDAVLSVRSDVALTPTELAVARPWLASGGRLVIVADVPGELVVAEQLLEARLSSAPVRDGAFDGDPSRPLVPHEGRLYQLDGALAVNGGDVVVRSPGLAWTVPADPDRPEDLAPFAFAAVFEAGSGAILVVGDSHPLSNGGRGERDNAALAADVAAFLSGDGAVFIDEGHRSGVGVVRVDLALRALGDGGRTTLAVLAAAVMALALLKAPSRLAALVARSLRAPADLPPQDALTEVAARHPEWDPRILHRLWIGSDDAEQGGAALR